MKKHILIKSITFIIMIIFFLANTEKNMMIYAEPDTIISDVSEIVSAEAEDTALSNISDMPVDINHVQVTAQYVNNKKNNSKDKGSDLTVPKILILVSGVAIICFCIIWAKKTYLK